MKITINGNMSEHYAETLCMLFFPGSKFSKSEKEDASAPSAVFTVKEEGKCVAATVTLTVDGKSETASFSVEKNTESVFSEELIACGKAFLEVGQKLTGLRPAWGILTGIRPAKLALTALNSGKSDEEILRTFTEECLTEEKKAHLALHIAKTEKTVIDAMGKKTCSLYISIPFCPSRCSYCSFVSYTSSKLISLLDDYLARLCADIPATVDEIHKLGMQITTVYIGGGTPTTFDERQLKMLMETLSSCVDTSSLKEFTVEAGRPDTVTAEKMHILRNYGVTRVCINTQTLNDDILRAVGRKHTADDYFRAFADARNAGIPIINTDLIAGLPGDDFGSFCKSVDGVLSVRPENVTFHTLCIKNAADFAKERGRLTSFSTPHETELCVDYSQKKAAEAGYFPYYLYRQKNAVDNLENVGFSLPGAEGLYNIYMMEEIQTIFSVGAGAVTKLVSSDGKTLERIFEYKYPYEYLADTENKKRTEKIAKIQKFYLENT